MHDEYFSVMPAHYWPPELVRLPALELSAAIRERRVACREVMSAYLEHIDAVNPIVNAIVSLQDRDQLMAQAEARDSELDRGEYRAGCMAFRTR